MIDKGNQIIFERKKMTIKNESGFLIYKRDQTRQFGARHHVYRNPLIKNVATEFQQVDEHDANR